MVMDWAMDRHGGVNVLSAADRAGLEQNMRTRLAAHARHRVSEVRVAMAASLAVDIMSRRR